MSMTTDPARIPARCTALAKEHRLNLGRVRYAQNNDVARLRDGGKIRRLRCAFRE